MPSACLTFSTENRNRVGKRERVHVTHSRAGVVSEATSALLSREFAVRDARSVWLGRCAVAERIYAAAR